LTTNVSIDGFNLYYGCLKGTPHRWLDLEALVRRLLPNDDVRKIRYFTARVSARSNDDRGPVSQSTYLRALATLPKVSVHLGHFLTSTVSMPLATPPQHGPRTARVVKTEEKGSGVTVGAQGTFHKPPHW
jgi:hypothetical protein